MIQRTIFDSPAPHNNTPTSIAAALAQTPTKRQTKRDIILDLIQLRGGCTNDELCELTGWGTGTICPRVNELTRMGLIRKSGKNRDTRSGHSAAIWISI